MATNFPTSLDTFTNPSAANKLGDVGVVHHEQHANLNDAVAALQAKVGIDSSAVATSLDYLVRHLLPSGVIVMWSGSIATIPSGWYLCDGNNGTPDLRDKFVVGANQDSGGLAKTNIEGSLKQTGGVTGHSHSAHANLSHAGGAVGDHTGLTHGITIANHPDLTHAALSHPAITITHADHSIASHANITVPSHSHATTTVNIADHSIASHANITVPSHSHATTTVNIADHSVASHANITVPSHSHATTTAASVSGNTGVLTTPTAATRGTLIDHDNISGVSFASIAGASIAAATYTHAAGSVSGVSFASIAGASIAAATYTHAAGSVSGVSFASVAGASIAAATLTHADHSLASLSHQAIGTHVGTDYGVHTVTAPAAHGAAGTLTHSFTQPSDHTISAHDTVLSLPTYYALAFIQKA